MPFEIPEGYRFLKIGEVVLKEDFFSWCGSLDINNWNSYNNTPYITLGKPFSVENAPVIRKIKNEVKQCNEQVTNVIKNELKKHRAFNQDSALKVKEKQLPYYLFLTKNNIIKECEGKFYLDKEQENLQYMDI